MGQALQISLSLCTRGLHLPDRRLMSVQTTTHSLAGFFSSKLRENRTQDHYSRSFFIVTKVYRDHLLILGEGTSCKHVFKRRCCHVKTILLAYEVMRTWMQSTQAHSLCGGTTTWSGSSPGSLRGPPSAVTYQCSRVVLALSLAS